MLKNNMNDIFEIIRQNLEKAPVYKTENNYQYFIYPYKGLTPANPKELDYLARLMAKNIGKEVDLIFSFEMDGALLAYKVASLLNKPFVCAKSFYYNLKNIIKFKQKTGYYSREVFFSLGDLQVKKVAIVDCLYSTGGSISAAVKVFDKLGITVSTVCVAVNKLNYHNQKYFQKIKAKFFAIYDVEIKESRVKAVKSRFFK